LKKKSIRKKEKASFYLSLFESKYLKNKQIHRSLKNQRDGFESEGLRIGRESKIGERFIAR
jgi:hypothetical protein